MHIVFCALFDPRIEQVFLAFAENPIGILWRHSVNVIARKTDAPVNLAILEISRHNSLESIEIFGRVFTSIDPKIGSLILRVRPMAVETLVGKNWTDIAIKVDFDLILSPQRAKDRKENENGEETAIHTGIRSSSTFIEKQSFSQHVSALRKIEMRRDVRRMPGDGSRRKGWELNDRK